MGSSASQEDQDPLLEEDEGIQPVFEELKLVLVGSQGAGKNTIGNAIFRKKIFTFWTSYRSVHIKETHTVSGIQINLVRTPGWKGELHQSEKTRMEIVHCVQSLYDNGPHAVLLALNVNSGLSKSNICTLETLLSNELWNHTIVVFTNGEKLGGYTIEDHIRCNQLQTLMDKCGQRYFMVKKNCHQITDTIEEFILKKNSASCFKLSPQREVDNNTLVSDWTRLVKRLKSKIASLSTFREKLKLKPKTPHNEKLLKSKDDEIKRLNDILKEKEREIARLRSGSSRTQESADLLDLHIRIEELEYQLKMKCEEVEEKVSEIEELKYQLLKYKSKAEEWRTREDQQATVHADIFFRLMQSVSTGSCTQIPLQTLASNGRVIQQEWGVSLLQILDELTDDQLKTMKDLMRWRNEWKIPRRSMEGKTRGELVDLIIEKWGERESVPRTRDLIKEIPRNDDRMIDLFTPFLKEIGQTW